MGNRDGGDQSLPLSPLTGAMWVPVWALRPGSYDALVDLTAEMPLFLALHSRNADYWRPCYASRESLGATLGVSRATVGRRLARLEDAGLVFKVDRGVDRHTQQHRPPARWALDPFKADKWRPKIETVLADIAEEDGHDGRWLHRAVTSLDAFDRRCRLVGARISQDMPVPPPRRRSERRPKKKRKPKSTNGAGVNSEPWDNGEPRGEGFSTGGVGGEETGGQTERGQRHRRSRKEASAVEGKPGRAAGAVDDNPSHPENRSRNVA